MPKKMIIIGNTAHSLLLFRKELLKIFVNEGWLVYCFALDFNDATRLKVMELNCIPVDYKLKRGGLNPIQDFIDFLNLKKLIKPIAPDLVFSYFAKPVIFGTLAAKLLKIKRIVCMLEGLGYYFTEKPERPSFKDRVVKLIQIILYRVSLPLADMVIFLNNDDVNDLLEKYHIPVKLYSILGPIGLCLEKFSYKKEYDLKDISFIFVGRFLREKGVFEFLKAAEKVKHIFPDTNFYLIGDIDYENPGALTKSDLNYYIDNKTIIHPGFIDDVANWLRRSSVFVLPSYREGFPRSTQEAMATGCPVITTNVAGCRDSILDGVNGFLVRRWSVDDLCEKMVYFIKNQGRIKEMGMESFKIAHDRFDDYKNNEKLYKLILDL